MRTKARARSLAKQRKPWPQVRRIKYKTGGRIAWMVDGRTNGKGERLFFDTKLEADAKADALRIERRNNGTTALAIPAKLRIEAAECAERLKRVGASLTEATDFFILHARPEAGAKSLADVVSALLADKERAGRRPQYLSVQKYVLGNFAAAFGSREIHTISHEDISGWMNAQPWKLRTRENYRRDLSNLFGFAMRHGYCAKNPMSRMERATLDDTPPGILTVSEAARLLAAASLWHSGILLPYVAIGLFAGLRASELVGLAWSDVSLEERTIEVKARVAKSRARRIVTMSDNLAAWLAPYRMVEGRIAPPSKCMWGTLRKEAGFQTWPKNALRHSFASYHVAFHRNAPQTSLEMGHDNPNQLFQSYRELVKPADAKRYWQITPTSGANIVPMTTRHNADAKPAKISDNPLIRHASALG
jgi:integrase